tara:strand:+ start:642 stop:1001 length:360 start_codon:yes stop_codon:yes gene_type:complete
MIFFIQKFWLQITFLLLTTIATLSLWPAAYLPEVPGTDKIHHFIAYAALMFPTVLKQHKYMITIALSFIAFSGAIELIQPYVNRYGEWLDMSANTLGLACGWLLAKVTLYFFNKKSNTL